MQRSSSDMHNNYLSLNTSISEMKSLQYMCMYFVQFFFLITMQLHRAQSTACHQECQTTVPKVALSH